MRCGGATRENVSSCAIHTSSPHAPTVYMLKYSSIRLRRRQAGAEDFWLRVFDSATGEELQKVPLPVPAVATPMTYTLDGRQCIVVAAGGHGDGAVPLGDSLMAFAVD